MEGEGAIMTKWNTKRERKDRQKEEEEKLKKLKIQNSKPNTGKSEKEASPPIQVLTRTERKQHGFER